MTRYTVLNTTTEVVTEHYTWAAAYKAASKQNPKHIVITEYDRDGSRQYNVKGEVIQYS